MSEEPLTPAELIEIHQLMALYGHVADGSPVASLAEVFTPDAVFDATAVNAGRHEGIPRIAAFFGLGKPPHPPAHQSTNVYAYRDGPAVRVVSKFLTLNVETGFKLGDYEDEVVLTEHGWRIKSRAVLPRYYRASGLAVGETTGAVPTFPAALELLEPALTSDNQNGVDR